MKKQDYLYFPADVRVRSGEKTRPRYTMEERGEGDGEEVPGRRTARETASAGKPNKLTALLFFLIISRLTRPFTSQSRIESTKCYQGLLHREWLLKYLITGMATVTRSS